MSRARGSAYYRVAEVDLATEMDRLRGLSVFAAGPLAARRPRLKVRRARRRPRTLGFAVPREWRISVTAYPGIRAGDALEVLLHELVHLHVGEEPGGRRWHGQGFKQTLRRAMTEAYGVRGVRPRNVHHGPYADAIERRRRASRRAAPPPGQLRLDVAA